MKDQEVQETKIEENLKNPIRKKKHNLIPINLYNYSNIALKYYQLYDDLREIERFHLFPGGSQENVDTWVNNIWTIRNTQNNKIVAIFMSDEKLCILMVCTLNQATYRLK